MRHGRGDAAGCIEWRTEKENSGPLHVDARALRHPAMAAEAGMSEEEYWEQIIDACFLDERGPDRALARGQRADRRLRSSASTRSDRAPARRGRGRRPLGRVGEQRRWVGGQRTQHPELRDLHEPRLARHGGLDRASTSRSTATATSCAGIRLEFADGRVVEATAEENERVITRDDRDRERRPGRRVLADRPALLADHQVHGARPSTTRTSAARSATPTSRSASPTTTATPATRRGRRRGVGAARLQRLERAHRHRLDQRPHRHRARCAAASSGDLPGGEFQLD